MSTHAPILATHGLGLDIGGATIVADVGLEVDDGEFLAIIGPNGAGKTSLFNLVSGLLRPTAGRVILDGRDVTREPPYRRTRLGLGRTFQLSSVFPALPALENVPELVDVIRTIHAEEGKTVLMVEHHMEVVTGLAQRIAVMHHGRLLAVDTPDAVMRNETVQQAYVGEPL